MNLFLRFIPIVFFLFYNSYVYSQELTEAQIKASYIYNFAININWPNFNEIDTFKIAILGENTQLYDNLKLMKKSKTIKGKPIEIIYTNDFEKVLSSFSQIVYVCHSNLDYLSDYFWFFIEKHSLIITDGADRIIYTMINFYKKGDKILFVINEQNIESAGLEVNKELLILGGSNIDIYRIFKEMEEERIILEEKLKGQTRKIDSLSKIISLQKGIIDSLNFLIKFRQKKINQLEVDLSRLNQQLYVSKKILDSLQNIIIEKENYLILKDKEINKKYEQIEKLRTDIKFQYQIYRELRENIEKKKLLLERQEQILSQYQKKLLIEKKRNYFFIAYSILTIIIFLIIFLSFKTIKRKNKQLEAANRLIYNQAEELKVVNDELEKVSLAASKADNVIYLLSAYGTIEWVNSAVETKYFFNKAEIIGKKLYELTTVSSEQIVKFIEQCRTKKETVIYEVYFKKRDGSYIWVQTTLTPVVSNNGEVNRIIALDSDITKVKLAAYEIEKKNEQLMLQQEILLRQKEQIESQNKIINSSIEYANNIQSSIMPSDGFIRSLVKDYFLIFRPLQIVSGDFYWMAEDDENKDIFYTAVIDCTGHGVPGAFMSLVAERLLHEIIFMKNIKKPSDILINLDEMIVKVLGTSNNKEKTLAGLDIILLKVLKKQKRFDIIFAGAKRPLVYYIPGENDIEYIKTERISVGQDLFQRSSKKVFSDYHIEVPQGTIFYLFTDGITDQYCKFLKKKIGTKRLLNIISEMKNEDLLRQKFSLETYLNYCLKDEEQRDDITFWAIKF